MSVWDVNLSRGPVCLLLAGTVTKWNQQSWDPVGDAMRTSPSEDINVVFMGPDEQDWPSSVWIPILASVGFRV